MEKGCTKPARKDHLIPGKNFENLEKSWKYHGILSVSRSGNPALDQPLGTRVVFTWCGRTTWISCHGEGWSVNLIQYNGMPLDFVSCSLKGIKTQDWKEIWWFLCGVVGDREKMTCPWVSGHWPAGEGPRDIAEEKQRRFMNFKRQNYYFDVWIFKAIFNCEMGF